MAKRGSIVDNMRVSKVDKELARRAGEPVAGPGMSPNVRLMKTTAINIPTTTWTLLRAVAFARAQATGERPSVSALITELTEQHRAELEREAGV